MVLNGQRTVFGNLLQLYMLAGQPYKLLSNTTLNDKYNLHPVRYVGELPKYPKIDYLAIGIGGQSSVPTMEEYSFSQHRPIDAALFNQVPFRIRTPDNDLPYIERTKYRFRMVEIIDGRDYVCYYLKKIPLIDIKENIFLIESVEQIDILKIFNTNTEAVISPAPVDKTKILDNIAENKASYVSTLMSIKFELLNEEIRDIDKYIELKNFDTKIITELGICTGIDVQVGEFKEASAVQVAFHCSLDINFTMYLKSNGHILRDIDIGGMEPLVIC